MIVVIDGPAGSGKSSTAHRVAKACGFVLMDSGMMYRTIALAFLQRSAECTEAAARQLLTSLCLDITFNQGCMNMHLNGNDVTPLLRAPKISAMASRIATIKSVRQYLLSLQRRLATRYGLNPGLVAEGRDMGTVVFPEADLKFFLTASMKVRALRRLQELRTQGEDASYQEVFSAIETRDEQDTKRSLAPLRQAPDAILIDTDQVTLDRQTELILRHIRERTHSIAR